mgnify:CR=1 FL=1
MWQKISEIELIDNEKYLVDIDDCWATGSPYAILTYSEGHKCLYRGAESYKSHPDNPELFAWRTVDNPDEYGMTTSRVIHFAMRIDTPVGPCEWGKRNRWSSGHLDPRLEEERVNVTYADGSQMWNIKANDADSDVIKWQVLPAKFQT